MIDECDVSCSDNAAGFDSSKDQHIAADSGNQRALHQRENRPSRHTFRHRPRWLRFSQRASLRPTVIASGRAAKVLCKSHRLKRVTLLAGKRLELARRASDGAVSHAGESRAADET